MQEFAHDEDKNTQPTDYEVVGAYFGSLLVLSAGADMQRLRRLSKHCDIEWINEAITILQRDPMFGDVWTESGTQSFIDNRATVLSIMDDVFATQYVEIMFWQSKEVCEVEVDKWSQIIKQLERLNNDGRISETQLFEAKNQRKKFQRLVDGLAEGEQTMQTFKEALLRSIFPEEQADSMLQDISIQQIVTGVEGPVSRAMELRLLLKYFGLHRRDTPNQKVISSLESNLFSRVIKNNDDYHDVMAALQRLASV